MKCSLCGKKGVQLSHFSKKHGSTLARRSAAARARNKGAPSKGRRKSKSSGAEGAPVMQSTAVHYCPLCGRPH